MYAHSPLKAARNGYLILSVLLCLFGLVLMFYPGVAMATIGVIAGVLALVFGVVKIVGYFSKDLYQLAFQHDLAAGVLLAVIGLVVFTHPNSLMMFICIMIGIYTLLDGLLRLQTAMDAKKFGLERWWLIFLSAIVACVLGVMLIFNTVESGLYLVVFLGMTLLAEGVLNMITVLTASKRIRDRDDDITVIM